MQTVTMSFNIDEAIYKDAKKILDSIGISMEKAINLFFKAVIAKNGLPFPLSEEELELIRDKRMGDGI